MQNRKPEYFLIAVLIFLLAASISIFSQDAPDVGPHPPAPPKRMESHIGNLTGHSENAMTDYRAYCVGCHGETGDGNGENAQWLDPKPRNFILATFKCRSTLTGTLPTDLDLYDSIGRGFTNSNMPIWNTLSKLQRADLVAYIKTFSPRWQKEKPGEPIKIPSEPPITIASISHGKSLYVKLECWKCHGPQGKGDGPTAATLTDSLDNPIRPYDFASGQNDSRFKCGSTNEDVYRIFMTGMDGTPMPSYAELIQPNDAWDLVHFLRTLQAHRHSKEK
jgi:mono/diheme cytochrome c family protein